MSALTVNALAYKNMIAGRTGFFQEDDHLELIQGELIYMAAKGVAHEVCITRLLRELPQCLGGSVTLRCQSPVALPPDSEPEPDFAIVRNREDDYFSGHPQPANILWLIEVSDSSITNDQSVKLAYLRGPWHCSLLDFQPTGCRSGVL